MNRNKHKILVLSDLKENAKDTLQYAITIAKEFNGALELLCIRKPKEIVTIDNPLSAMRSVSNEFIKTEQKAKSLVRSMTKDDFFPVKSTIKLGNVKTEIEDHIKNTNPDFIILGKKQKRLLNLNRDSITNYVLKNYGEKVCVANQTTNADICEILNAKNKKNITA